MIGMSRIKSFFLGVISAIWEFVVLMWLTFYYTAESIILFLTPSFMRAQISLKNKVILVTGGAGGVGQELAIRLARLKAKVIIWDINEKGKINFYLNKNMINNQNELEIKKVAL